MSMLHMVHQSLASIEWLVAERACHQIWSTNQSRMLLQVKTNWVILHIIHSQGKQVVHFRVAILEEHRASSIFTSY